MKRKTLAILLSALLVVSALFVLVACNPGETTTEYVITFRDYNSKILFQGQTVDGVIVQDKTLAREGYTFDGWYKNLSADKDGNLVYENKVTIYGTKFTADTELYAKWNANEVGGDEEGYGIAGTVNEWKTENIKWRMAHDKDHPSIYTITFDVTSTDQFKVKKFISEWKGLECGGDKIKEVKLAEGVTVPTGVEQDKLVVNESGNIACKQDMNITVQLNYNAVDEGKSTLTITVNKFNTATEPTE